MQLMSKHEDWIRALPGTPTITGAANTAGIQRTTLLRQLERGFISAPNVISLCRAHGKSPVDGLVETGYLDAEELRSAGIPDALRRATNQQLLDGVMKRVDPNGRRLLHGGITPMTPRGPVAEEAPATTESGTEWSNAARNVDGSDEPKPE